MTHPIDEGLRALGIDPTTLDPAFLDELRAVGPTQPAGPADLSDPAAVERVLAQQDAVRAVRSRQVQHEAAEQQRRLDEAVAAWEALPDGERFERQVASALNGGDAAATFVGDYLAKKDQP